MGCEGPFRVNRVTLTVRPDVRILPLGGSPAVNNKCFGQPQPLTASLMRRG
jgi:hypothetical protein